MKRVEDATLGVASADLEAATAAIQLRLVPRAREARRVEQTMELLNASAALNRSLAIYTQHALVHSQGSFGTADLAADMARLHLALAEFFVQVKHLADAYRSDAMMAASGPAHTDARDCSASRLAG